MSYFVQFLLGLAICAFIYWCGYCEGKKSGVKIGQKREAKFWLGIEEQVEGELRTIWEKEIEG